MASGNGDDDKKESWLWNDKMFQSIKAEHDKFFNELRDEGKRLEKELSSEGNKANENDHAGPFSSFKRFVDNNLGTLAAGFKNFPSNISELKSRMQQEQERWREEEMDISRRWTGSTDSPDHIAMEISRSTEDEKRDAYDAMIMLLNEAEERNAHVPSEKIEALYRDPEHPWGMLDKLASGRHESSEGSSVWHTFVPQPRWLSVKWFKRSSYSPIRLEAHQGLGGYEGNWRAAFEDLMNASLDKPMDSREWIGVREPHGRPQSTYSGPGLEWLLSLQCRGVLPPLLSRHYCEVFGRQRSTPVETLLGGAQTEDRYIAAMSNGRLRAQMSMQGGLAADIIELLPEIATKATADSEAEPLPPTAMPETEQDLYDAAYVFPTTADIEEQEMMQRQQQVLKEAFAQEKQACKSNARQAVYHSSTPVQALYDADDALYEALATGDAQAAADVLTDFYKKHNDISELVEEPVSTFFREFMNSPTSEWFPVLNEALRRSEIPDDDGWKLAAFSSNADMMEKLDSESMEDKRRRRQLEEQLRQLLGPAGLRLGHQWRSIQELEDIVERYQQEYSNLQDMVHPKTAPRKLDDEIHRSAESGVLSALTTTQTTKLPDGSITTKVVLKKRFADGREETTETVQTTREAVEQHLSTRLGGEPPKQKGWFWS